MKIMPLDPYSTLGRSCEPAYQVNCRPEACAAISCSGWRLVCAWRPRGELLAHLAGKLCAAFIAVEESGEALSLVGVDPR
jgi:hypothetical protein